MCLYREYNERKWKTSESEGKDSKRGDCEREWKEQGGEELCFRGIPIKKNRLEWFCF